MVTDSSRRPQFEVNRLPHNVFMEAVSWKPIQLIQHCLNRGAVHWTGSDIREPDPSFLVDDERGRRGQLRSNPQLVDSRQVFVEQNWKRELIFSRCEKPRLLKLWQLFLGTGIDEQDLRIACAELVVVSNQP